MDPVISVVAAKVGCLFGSSSFARVVGKWVVLLSMYVQ
jgi:hypothetical protein